MFLNTFSNEEKEKFLSLVYLTAKIDGNYADEEAAIIENYKIQLGIDKVNETYKLADLITFFASKEIQVKKVVLFEVYGLIISDEHLGKSEEKVLCEIENAFALGKDTIQAIKEVVTSLKEVYDKVFEVLV